MHRIFYALLILAIGAIACSQPSAEPQQRSVQRNAPSSTPKVVHAPTAVSKIAARSSPPASTAPSGPAPVSTVVAIIPSPTPASTAAPASRPTLKATSVPKPATTPAATSIPVSPEDIERHESFMENFKSISYEASLELPDRFTESDGPVTANASGWMMANGASQMFVRIEMTEPVERCIEVVTLNSFDIYLKDLNEGRWYFIPENSDADTGPLEDIMPLPFMALLFGVAPAGELEPVQDGYVWKVEDQSWGAITASYDQAHMLKEITRADANGREILRAKFFDLNEPHRILPHEKGELLSETYWEPQPGAPCPTPTQAPTEAVGIPAAGDADPEPARQRATEFLARELGATATDLEVLSATTVTWSDASLGCPQPSTLYAQVLTSGYLVVIRDAGRAEHRVHTNEDGSSAIVCDN